MVRVRMMVAFLALLGWLGAGTAVRADGPPAGGEKGKPPAKPAEEKPEFPKFEEVCKDFEQVRPGDLDETGFLTLWYNKKSDDLYAQVPASLVNRQFLIASSVSGGESFTGFQLDHWIAYFERQDKTLVLMQLDPRYAKDSSEPVTDVVKRSYADVIVRAVPIKTLKNSDPVIDLGDLFKGDFSGLLAFDGSGTANPALSKWLSYKSFAQNVELSVEMAVMSRGGYGQRLQMHYSLSGIPKSDYKPRPADDRVGYFMTVRYDWGKKYDAKTLFNRYINRWNLQKSDPSLDLSPVKEPIVWYIEKTVPIRWRRYVAEGILEWNKAFEKCGFVNAMQVRQQEADGEFARLDPEDVRYNFFRWIVTGQAFAMGPSRDHPLTGQIFDADIVFDDSMVREYVLDFGRYTGTAEAIGTPESFLNDFFRAHPEWQFRTTWSALMPNVRRKVDESAAFREHLLSKLAERGRPMCDCAAGVLPQVSLARLALQAKGLGPKHEEEFLGQMIKYIVMHEVGHCLGLRHNFKSSTWKSMEDVAACDDAHTATIGSVMEYAPPVIAPRGATQGSYTARTIGPYDYWAIEYGYRQPGKDDKGEDEMLKKIASRGAEEGLDYATDEDTFGVLSADPTSNRWDMGRDVMAYASRQIDLTKKLLSDVMKWDVKDGDSFSRLRRTFVMLVWERSRVNAFVSRFVGGQVVTRDHKGDPNARPPIQPVEAERQRTALEFVVKNVFSEDSYTFDAKLLNHLAPGRFWHWNSDDFDFEQEFNVHDLVLVSQYVCLFTMMNPFTVTRVHDAEVKFGEDEEPYTLAEHFDTLTAAIWSELDRDEWKGTSAAQFIRSFRRNLQRLHLQMLLNYVLGTDLSVPPDARSLARMTVSDLSERIKEQWNVVKKRGTLDSASRAHLMDVKKRIDKALEAEYTYRAAGSGGRSSGMDAGEASDRPEERVPVLPIR